MHNDEELTRLWISYVRAHLNILESATAKADTHLLQVRQYMSSLGAELTPHELKDFTSFLKETIEYIKVTEKL